MLQAYAAISQGYTPYIRWSKLKCPGVYFDNVAFNACPNMWEWYFEQPFCNVTEVPKDALVVGWIDGARQPFIEAANLYAQSFEFQAEFHKKHLKFNAKMEACLAGLVAKYSVKFSSTVAVACRGTDKWTEVAALAPIESCFKALDDFLVLHPDFRIFTKPEQAGMLEVMLKRYPQAFTMPEFFVATQSEKQMMDRVSPFSGYERGKQAVLLIMLYSRCACLLKNEANLAHIAALLSKGAVTSYASG